ncbi:sensor histidine kinase [Actinomadura sp. SCN-SB]|uniref:sensor histidine kinase n=1 Tax=Actinomadura sp. SCN-SB TaxID=3373092 RepID=UPI003750F4E7
MRARLTAVATAVAGALLVLGALGIYAAASLDRGGMALDLALGIGFAVALGAVARILWGTVGGALRPVQVMSRELKEIADKPGECRVSVPPSHDEVAELARSVNVTLEHLERMAERRHAFVADASHELRSPLTGLRTRLEVALEHPEDEDWPTVARAALESADRLQLIVRDLLVLAKLEAGVRAEQEKIDLGELVETEIARRAGRVPIDVRVADAVVVFATRSHLVRLLTNLLDNAERHAESQIRVAVGTDDRDALLMVADDGPGIPPEERERVFQRFLRLPEGRRADDDGTGLGLPISRDIAQAHGGSLVVGDGPGGARLICRLPLY